MKTWSFWDSARGEFTGRRFSADDGSALAANTPPGCRAIEGVFDRHAHRVDEVTGKVVVWRTPQPSDDHEWDADEKAWRLSRAALRRDALARIHDLEAQQARPFREISIARELGEKPSAEALERLLTIERQISELRATLKTLKET